MYKIFIKSLSSIAHINAPENPQFDTDYWGIYIIATPGFYKIDINAKAGYWWTYAPQGTKIK